MDFDEEKAKILKKPNTYPTLAKLKERIDARPPLNDQGEVDEFQYECRDLDKACQEFGWQVNEESKNNVVKLLKAYADVLGWSWDLTLWNKYPYGPMRKQKQTTKATAKKSKGGFFSKKKDKEDGKEKKVKKLEKSRKEKKSKKKEEDSDPDDIYFHG